MSQSPEFATTEAGGAQLQALHTLINCGWRYVTRAEADQWRHGSRALTFLETQLRTDLNRINRINYNDRSYTFSEPNIDVAVRRLADRIPEGVVRANERMTDDLTLGIALPQSIGQTSREWPFKYIDWNDWRANTFQVTSEYSVAEPVAGQSASIWCCSSTAFLSASSRLSLLTSTPTKASASRSATKKPMKACPRCSTPHSSS